MRIGIDGRPFMGKRTGVGRYVFELCKGLDRHLPRSTFFIYSNLEVEMPVVSDRWILRLDNLPISKHMKPILWLKLRCGALCKQDCIDVFWGSATFLPRLPGSLRKVVTVYDLTYRFFPQTMGITHRLAHELFFKRDIGSADSVLVISEGTANRLYKITGRKVTAIVRPAVDKCFRPVSQHEVEQCMKLYGITGPYILAVGTWEPRKNLELLIKVFISMKDEGTLSNHKLILVGGGGWKDKKLTSLIKNDDRQKVITLGYVSDEHLPSLYTGADVFVFPSLYEGFGIPVLEAVACEAKVVASDIPEIREAGGENVIYISPTAKGIQDGIMGAISHNKKKVTMDLDFPSWEEGAKTLARALKGTDGEEKDDRL